MKAIQRKLETALRVFLMAVMLINALAPAMTAAAAVSTPPQVPPAQLASKPDLSNGLTLGNPYSPKYEKVPVLSAQLASQAQVGKTSDSKRIKVSAEPSIYIPGQPIHIQWKLIGFQPGPGTSTSVVMHAPAGVTPVDPSQVLAADGSLTLAVSAAAGSVDWNVGASAVLPLEFTFDLNFNGVIVDNASLSLDQALYSTTQGRSASFDDQENKVHLDIPAGAANEGLFFDVRRAGTDALDGTSLSWQPVEILAVGKNSRKNDHKFNAPITIQMHYDPTQNPGVDENALTIYYYDPDQQDWFPMETQVDTVNKTLTTHSDHLTVFDYKANDWQSQSLPTVDTFKVSDFTGAASYNINLWTPPGPGGLQPSLALSYNSQVFDEASAFSQPAWVGMGWSLDTGAIIRNMHGTDTNTADDTFSISAGGVSGLLLPVSVSGTVTSYNTADQSFMNVQFDSAGNTWTAWAKDGTKYVFATPASTNSSNGCATTLDLTWRWSLTSITDTHNNTLAYTYYTETKSGCANQIAVYPDTITYPNNKYRVVFVRDAAARTDLQTSWTTAASRTLYGTLRLSEVDIQYNPGTWTNVKRYVLSYAANTATSNIIYPNFVWSKGGKTLTLLGVQEFGTDGSALPAAQFTYGDSMHLTNVNNGQGGQVQMTYSSRWTYFDDINKIPRNFRTNFGTGGNECNGGSSTTVSWTWVSGGNVRCDSTGYMQVGGVKTSVSLAVAEHTIPESMVKPGARYWYYVKVRSIAGTQTFHWGMRDAGTNTLQMLPAQSVGAVSGGAAFQLGLEMPATFNPNNTRLRLDCGYCFFKDIQFIEWPLEYFVSQRSVTTQPSGQVSTYTYQYDNPAPNTSDTSAASAAGGVLYTPNLREFRGNSMTESVDPAGKASLTWFNQSDTLKGKPYDQLAMQQSFYDSMDIINPDWVATGGTHTASGVNYQIDGGYIQSTNTAANWNVSFARAASSITSGKMAIARVRLSGAAAQGEAGLVSGSGQFFGVTLSAAGAVLQNGATLIPAASFKKDTWYVLMLFADDANGFRARIWQANDPSVSGEAVANMAGGQAWKFRERINNGTQSLGVYIEGTPYNETITSYASTVQYDTVAGNGIPDLAAAGLLTFTDLQVAWNRPSAIESRNYNGGSAFVGTRQVFGYAAQYGNLISTTDYSGDNGAWTAYRASQTEYYPNPGTYVVGLPARQVTYACAADCATNTLAESLNFYDGSAVYTGQPTRGELSMRRAWVQGADYSQAGYSYDSFGNALSQSVYTAYGTAASAPDPASIQTSSTNYGADGYNTYPVSVTNPLGQTTSTVYNYALGLPVSLSDPNGAVTSATYDGFGRIKSITAPYDTTPTLQVTYYDTRIPFQIDLTQAVNGAASIRLSRFYDGAGRQIQTQSVGALVNGAQKNVVTDVQYNNLGQLVKQTVPYSIPYNAAPSFSAQAFTNPYTSTSYDILGRVDTLTAPNGNQTHTSYTRAGSTTTDPQSNATSTSLDAWGRATLVHPPLGPDVAYVYDVLNRLTDSTRAGQTTHISYDAAGRKLGMSDPDMGIWAYGYDALGNLKLQTDARGCALALSYDNLNRLTAKTSSGAGCGTQVSSSYTYDAGAGNIGRRTGMNDASGSTAWSYDLRGRMTQEVKTISGMPAFTTAWTYNSADLPVTMTYPDGEVVTNGYNSDGALKAVTSSLGATYLNDMQVDEAGRTTLMDYGAGVIRKTFAYFAWNTASQGGLLQGMQAARLSDSVPLQNLAYTYEKNGNALSITDSLAGPEAQNFGYDALNRLTSAAASGGTNGLYSETYTYDPASGNMAGKGGVTYTYADPAHAHAVTALSNGNSYAYDPNGDMTQRVVGGQTYNLGYDAENRMVSVSGAVTASFLYDGDGKRVMSTISASTTYFVGNIYEVANGVVTKYYYAGGQRIALRSAGVVSFLLGDHLGSTSLTTDAAGLVTSEQRYTAWGEVRFSSGSAGTKYTYTGQYSNVADFGLMFYNARWLDPGLGRFAQADSVVPGRVQGLDRYAGMGNNPVGYVDPSGHSAECILGSSKGCLKYAGLNQMKGFEGLSDEVANPGYLKSKINRDFGVTLDDGGAKHPIFVDKKGNPTSYGRGWDETNSLLVYQGLANMNNVLKGNLKTIIGSVTFTLNTHPILNNYYGLTTPGNVDFYNTITIPLQNLNHEFGHVLNNVAGNAYVKALGDSVHQGPDGYWFGGNEAGTLNSALVFKSASVWDPNLGPISATQHNDGTPSEQWADIWANYAAGNINQKSLGGSAMYDWTTAQLNP